MNGATVSRVFYDNGCLVQGIIVHVFLHGTHFIALKAATP